MIVCRENLSIIFLLRRHLTICIFIIITELLKLKILHSKFGVPKIKRLCPTAPCSKDLIKSWFWYCEESLQSLSVETQTKSREKQFLTACQPNCLLITAHRLSHGNTLWSAGECTIISKHHGYGDGFRLQDRRAETFKLAQDVVSSTDRYTIHVTSLKSGVTFILLDDPFVYGRHNLRAFLRPIFMAT